MCWESVGVGVDASVGVGMGKSVGVTQGRWVVYEVVNVGCVVMIWVWRGCSVLDCGCVVI